MAPPPFSYKVRVLAAIDAFYNPKHARPIRLASVEARYKRDCDSQKCTLPVSWRKRVQFTANKLVREGWLSTTNDGSYLLTPELRTTIETEKRRREVSPSSHDWNTFAAIVKAMEFPAGVPQPQNHASSSTPAGRTRGRTSLVSPIVAISARSPTGAAPSSNIFATRQANSNVPPSNGRSTPNTRSMSGAGPSSVNTRRESAIPSSPHLSSAPRPTSLVGPSRHAYDIRREVLRGKKVRRSDPGPRLILGTPIPSPSSGVRRSLGSSEQPTSASARNPPGASAARRRSSGSNRRRHTMAVPIQQQISFPAPVSKEIQFFPLKQALSARTRRALRRNALSEEMNNIDDERRAGQRRNREELAKLRAELAQSAERLRDLERELVAARYAPSEEPEPMSPIREDEEPERNDVPQAEDYDMDFAPLADSPAPPATPFRREMQSADGSGQETPVSARDKKIRDLEAMIEQLREDIKHREQEAAARAQEDEIFHDAEEQIFLEKSSSLMERIHDLEAERSKANDMAVAFEGAGEEIDADLDHVYTGPTADDFDDDVSDIEQLHDDMAFPSSAVDSAILVSSQVQASRTQTEINVYESESHSKKISELEDQNGGLQRMIDNLTDRIQDMQEEVRDSQTGLAEQEETTEALKAKVLKLKNQRQTLRLRIVELEEMEGERLESMQDLMVQTDEVVDERAILLEEEAERLNIQVSELQEMVEAVDAEKRAVDVRLLETIDQVSRLEAAVEAGERSREDVNSQLQDLSKMIELLKKETSILEAERAEMAAEIDELRDQLAILDREIGELRVENAGLKQEVSIQTEKVTGLEQTVDHLGKDRAALQESLHLLELDMETLEEAAQVAEETKDRLENEIEVLRDELKSQTDATEAAQKASEAFQRTISELRSQVDSLEKAIELSDQEKKSFLHNIDAFQIRVLDLEQQLKISGDHKENLEAQICRLNGQIRKLEEAIEVSETDKEKLEDTVEDLQNRISQHQSALENASNNRSHLESDIAQLTAQVTSLQEATIASNSEKEDLEREVDFLQKQVSTFEVAVRLSDDQTADLENEILNLSTQINMFKQAEEAVRSEKEQMEINMSGMMAQIQGLTGAGKIAQKEKEDLDKSIAGLNLQINILEEERDDAQAENRRLKLEITEYREEIASLTSRLENSNRENESLKQNIEGLEKEVVFLGTAVRDAHGGNTRLRQDIDSLNAEIRTLKRASALADEEKSMIQQKIRPYIHGEQSLDMAVEEVLTELVMEKNRADENERLRTELSKKIKILAQADEGMDMGSNPEETVERLTDRFREVRGYVEKLYSQCAQSEDSPFEGHELDDFAWTGSNEDALEVLRSLVGGLYEKLNEARALTVETEREKEKERKQRSLYSQYLDDIAIAVGVEGEQLPAEEGVLGLVTLRLSELRQQIGSAGERVEELQGSIQRKNDTIQSMEMDIEEACEREAGLSRKLVDAAATHEATTLQLNRAYAQIERLNQLNQDKVTEIEDLRVDLEASSEKERRLLDTIDQQASEHDSAVRELEKKRGEAVTRLEKLLEEEVLTKTRAEHIAAERAREDGEIIRELEERAAGWKAQYDALNVRLDMMKADHEDKVAQLKDTIAGGEGRITSLSEELREVLETSERDISALEDQLGSARDEIATQNSALSKVSAERNDVSRQLEAEILSSRDTVAGLEKRISEIKDESQLQQSRDHSRLSDLKHELEAHKAKSLLELEHSRSEIRARGEVIELHKARISELEALLDEAEESEAVLEEGIKSRESQLQLSYEEAARIKEALEAERDKLMEELAELRIVMERTRTDLTSDIEGLRTILEGREVRINDLEAVVGILRSERTKLAETVQELEAEQIRYQDMLESERQSGLEAVQALSHQAEKYMVRFGEVKQQYIRESARRQVEGKKASKRLREQDDEVDNDIADMLLHAPPTPASTIPRPLSVTHSTKKRESKRRKYDSGIGVEEEEEEEYTSVVPA